MSLRLSPALRLSLFYASVFSVVGLQLPYWPLYLSYKGLSPAEIGQVLAGGSLIRILANPLAGHIADGRGERRPTMIALAIVGLVSTAFYPLANGFSALLAVTLLSFAATSAMAPLGDSLTMQCAAARQLDYGRVRLWGSLSFIVVALLAGLTLVAAPRPAILLGCLACLTLTLGAALVLPDMPSVRPPGRPPRVGPLLADPRFLLFLGSASLTQGSHMIYYGFATLHWQAAGLSGGVIGALWAEGVIAEVVLFAFGARLVRRFGAVRLLAAASLATVVRWTVLAVTTDVAVLAAVQCLHAMTFGAGHLGAMHFIHRATPPGLAARAQAIYSSVTMGLASGLAMLVAGRLYQAYAGGAFLAMSALGAGGLGLALPLLRTWRAGRSVTSR
jgi:PPP family 3-phenylpropionic acid transporter